MKKSFILLCSIVFSYCNILSGQNIFPQKRVDEAFSKSLNDLKKNKFKVNNNEMAPFSENIFKKRNFFINDYIPQKPSLGIKGTLYIGPGNDTLLIDTNFIQNGDIVVYGNGVLIVDSAQLTLFGHLYGQDHGQVLLRNSAYLYVPQQYVSQYPQSFCDSSRFEAINSKIYANTCYRTFLYDNSEYIARHVDFPYWNFRQLYNQSRMVIEDARMVGDLTINDSCEVVFINCDTILPWFGFEGGDTLDIQFPDIDTVNHFVFDSITPGVKGIHYSVTFDTCRTVICGVESFPQSEINIHNSVFCGTLRINGSDTLYFENLRDHAFYTNLSIPFNDRNFNATNSYSQIWCIYTYDNIILYMDSCEWGESHAKGNSAIFADNSVSLGFPSCATSTESGFYYFTGGKCRAFVSSWNNGTTIIEKSVVTPDRPGGSAQTQNFAHDHSCLLAVNSLFDNEPEALDTSLVMFLYIDSLGIIDTDIANDFPITGSAWLQTGPDNPITFNQYKLFYQYVDSTSWSFIDGATDTVHWDTLGQWNVSGLPNGDYILKLTLWDSENDSLSTLREVTLSGTASLTNVDSINQGDIIVYPNPASGHINILSPVLSSRLKIYNELGNIVFEKTFNSAQENLNLNLSEGIYFLQVKSSNFVQTVILEIIK